MEPSQEASNANVVSLKYGIAPRGTYTHASKHCNIISVTFNTKTKQHVILDSRGVSGWFKNSLINYSTRLLDFDSYKFNLFRDIIYCRSANVYFAVSKDYGIKVYNLNFIEIFCIERDGTTIMKLVFNTKRSELIVISRNNFECWKYTIVEKSRACEGLKLLRKYSIPDSSISNAEYDDDLQRVYLLCEYNVWCYDVFGRCIAHYVHSKHLLSYLTVCTFSKQANTLIAGTSMGELSIYDTTGGLLITLLNHTQTITSLLAHPADGNLFVSSSMDGTLKIFSMQLFEQIYSINVFSDGIHWMKLRADNVIYCSSQRSVRLFHLNHICSFWGTVRSPVQSINISPKQEKRSSHIVVHGEDKCIRIYNKRSGRKKCTILPPPESIMMKDVLSFSYDRIGKVIYILFSEMELWIYITRTDPATRVAVWNIQDILKTNISKLASFEGMSKGFGVGSFSRKQEEEKVRCLCTGTVPRYLYTDRLETNCSLNFNLLMCGMSNGTVYFLDPSAPISIILGFKAHPTSPVVELSTVYGTHETRIITLIQTVDHLCVKIWEARRFMELKRIITRKDISVYLVKSSLFVSGDCFGNLRNVRLKHLGANISPDVTKVTYDTSPDVTKVTDDSKEHTGRIVSVDILESKELICSCGEDRYIRLWTFHKDLLTEIQLDESLCYSSFLRGDGSLLIGFKSHLFTIPSDILNLPNIQVDTSDESDTDSLVYEDPHIRQELKRHTELKTESLENYLIPYPYLNLNSKWMYQKTISDKAEEMKDEEEQSVSRPNSTTSTIDTHAPTEIYAESLCSTVCLEDIEMPKCCESPDLGDPIEKVDRQSPDFQQHEYEYDFVRSRVDRSRVEFPPTNNLLHPDKLRNEKDDMGHDVDDDITEQRLVDDITEQRLVHDMTDALRTHQRLVKGPTHVKEKQSAKKQKKGKKKGKFKSQKHSIKGSSNKLVSNNVASSQEMEPSLAVTPRNVINGKGEVANTSHMSDEVSSDEQSLKNIPVMAQLAVNYFSSSKRDLSTSSYRNMFQAKPSKNETESMSHRTSSEQYDGDKMIAGGINSNGSSVEGDKPSREESGNALHDVSSESGEEETLDTSNDEICVKTCEKNKEIRTYLPGEEEEAWSEEDAEVQKIFKEYKETNNVIKPVTRVRVADHYPVNNIYVALNNNFQSQTVPLSLLNDDRNLRLRSVLTNATMANSNQLVNDDASHRDNITLLSSKVRRLWKRYHSNSSTVDNNNEKNMKGGRRTVETNDIGKSHGEQTEYGRSLRSARNVKTVKDNNLKRNVSAGNRKNIYSTLCNRVVGVDQTNENIGFDFVFQGNDCPILPNEFYKSSCRENYCEKVNSNIEHNKDRQTTSVFNLLSTAHKYSAPEGLCNRVKPECDVTEAAVLPNKSIERCSGEERNSEKYIENQDYSDWSTIPPHIYVSVQDDDVDTSDNDPQPSLAEIDPDGYEYMKGCIQHLFKDNEKHYQHKTSRYKSHSSTTSKSLFSNNDKVARVNSVWSQSIRRRLSINSSPRGNSAPCQLHNKSPIHRHEDTYCYEEPTNIETNSSRQPSAAEKKTKRQEMITKLEHKLSGQPYRLHREKTQEEVVNDQVKLNILKSKDLGQQFLPPSKRNVSIPSKCEYRTIICQRPIRK